jgi:hypothetical protein
MLQTLHESNICFYEALPSFRGNANILLLDTLSKGFERGALLVHLQESIVLVRVPAPNRPLEMKGTMDAAAANQAMAYPQVTLGCTKTCGAPFKDRQSAGVVICNGCFVGQCVWFILSHIDGQGLEEFKEHIAVVNRVEGDVDDEHKCLR